MSTIHLSQYVGAVKSPRATLGAKQARFQAPWAMRRLMTRASATSTSIRSPPGIRSNRKYRCSLSCVHAKPHCLSNETQTQSWLQSHLLSQCNVHRQQPEIELPHRPDMPHATMICCD